MHRQAGQKSRATVLHDRLKQPSHICCVKQGLWAQGKATADMPFVMAGQIDRQSRPIPHNVPALTQRGRNPAGIFEKLQTAGKIFGKSCGNTPVRVLALRPQQQTV